MDGRFDDAYQFLTYFKKGEQSMKLGTVQRWVRDINVNTLDPEPMKVRLLDLVLRSTPEFKNFGLPDDEDNIGHGKIIFKGEWAPVEKQAEPTDQPVQFTQESFKVVKFEKAAERIPQNYFDLSIFTNNHIFDFARSYS